MGMHKTRTSMTHMKYVYFYEYIKHVSLNPVNANSRLNKE